MVSFKASVKLDSNVLYRTLPETVHVKFLVLIFLIF